MLRISLLFTFLLLSSISALCETFSLRLDPPLGRYFYSLQLRSEREIGTRRDKLLMKFTIVQEVLSKDDEGLSLRITYVPEQILINDQPITPKNRKSILLRLDRYGTPLKVSGVTREDAQALKYMTMSRIPRRTLKIGDIWQERTVVPGPSGLKVELLAEHEVKAVTPCGDDKCALIVTRLSSLTENVNYEGYSELLFNLNDKLITYSSSQVKAEVSVKLREGKRVTMRFTDTAILKLSDEEVR